MDLEDLEVYQLAEDLVLFVYRQTKKFPRAELYGLTSQIRRAGVSVLANIAEAWGRYHYKDRLHFLYNARGSLLELWALFKVSEKLDYWEDDEEFGRKMKNLRVKLNNYIQSFRKKS